MSKTVPDWDRSDRRTCRECSSHDLFVVTVVPTRREGSFTRVTQQFRWSAAKGVYEPGEYTDCDAYGTDERRFYCNSCLLEYPR